MGLTNQLVLDAAKRFVAVRSGPISIKSIADDLGVAVNSINSRLKRQQTSLERELAKELLSGLARPMLPKEGWEDYLRSLFSDAVNECEKHPGLARAVALWIGCDPSLCPEFTERILHMLGSAGLPINESASAYDYVLAALSGMLAVRHPDFGRDPALWADAVARSLARVDARRLPLVHRSHEILAATAREKMATEASRQLQRRFACGMAELVICFLQSKVA